MPSRPVTMAVAERACDEATDTAFDDAMRLRGELRGRFTSGFARRPMLVSATARRDRHTPVSALRPARDRYLVRPPSTVATLDLLCRDDVEYGRRPVADHLADLARRDPQLALRVACDG